MGSWEKYLLVVLIFYTQCDADYFFFLDNLGKLIDEINFVDLKGSGSISDKNKA